MRELHKQGHSVRAIAQRLQLDRRTVRKFALAPEFPEIVKRLDRPSQLDDHRAFVLERWEQGCHNAAALFRELSDRGYNGGEAGVRRFVQSLRIMNPAAGRTPAKVVSTQFGAETKSAPEHPLLAKRDLSPRMAARLMSRPPETLQDEERKRLVQMLTQSKECRDSYSLAQSFSRMLKERQPARLRDWLSAARESKIPELKTFARGIESDLDAVRAGSRGPGATVRSKERSIG